MNPLKISSQTLFWICFAIGLILRLYTLITRSFWFDESITYYFANLPIKSLLEASAGDNNPPLYYLLIHFLQKLSASEYIVRLPSTIFGIITIFASIKLSKKLALKDSYFVASLLSLSPLAIYLSAEARLHSLATMLVVLLSISFFNVFKNLSPKNSLILIIVATISFYTQYYLVLLVAPFFLIITTKFKKRFSHWLEIFLLPILLLGPWVLFSGTFQHNPCWCPNTIISLPASLGAPIIAGVGQITQRTFTSLPPTILLLFVLSNILFFYFFLKGLSKGSVVSLLYTIPMTIIAILGLFFNIFSPKGFSIFAPLYFLIIQKSNPKTYQKLLLLAILLAISTVQLAHPFFKEDNLKALYSSLSKYNVPIYHTSVISLYPMRFYSESSNNNHLILPNPLNSQTTKLIGGQKEDINPKTQQFLLVHSKTFTPQKASAQLFQNLKINYFQTLLLENKNLAIFIETKK